MLEQVVQKVTDVVAPIKAKKDAKKALSDIRALVDSVDYAALDREDVINLAYLRGKQWISWDRGNSRVFEPANTDKKTRYTANRLIKIVQNAKARIFKNRVLMDVVPASTEENDITSAKLAQKVADWLDYDKRLQERDSNLVLWGLSTRIAFVHPYWNPGLGQIADPETGLREGDVDFDVLSCFEVKFDTSATTWRDVRWACKIKVRDIDHVREQYGVEVKPEKGLTSNNIYDTKMMLTAGMDEKIKYAPLEHHVRVYEFWELPSKDYPSGRRVTYLKDRDEPLYTADDIGFSEGDATERQLPFFPFVAINLPGCVHGTNKLEQCRPIQREYNRTRSQLIDNKDLTAYPALLKPIGAMEDDPESEAGQVWEYDGQGRPPMYLSPPAMGQDVTLNMQSMLEEFDFVSGQSQISHGRAPSDASGYLVELLMEQDDTELSPTIDNYIDCKQQYMSYALKMIHFKYLAQRQLRIAGSEGVSLVDVQGSNITSWDVRVQRGSLIASSRVAKRSEILNLASIGVLNPQADRDQILRHLEMGTIDDIYNEAEQDQKQARKEQQQWETGQLPMDPKSVRDFFNHQVHIKEHNRWRKSDKYTQLDPESQAVIDAHVTLHVQFMLGAMMPQMPAGMPGSEPGAEPGAESYGTPPNPDEFRERVGNGEVVGNSMQGMPQGGAPNGQM